MSWDERWMTLAKLIASWSKDKNTKVGAVIVDNRNVLVSLGWNGLPRKVFDKPNEAGQRYERPEKYLWAEHAERNAIYNAAAKGHPLLGCTIYSTLYPCADCARAIIQSGITKIVAPEPNWDDFQWGNHYRVAEEMFFEAEINVILNEGEKDGTEL
jgi:dCMP deaminase